MGVFCVEQKKRRINPGHPPQWIKEHPYSLCASPPLVPKCPKQFKNGVKKAGIAKGAHWKVVLAMQKQRSLLLWPRWLQQPPCQLPTLGGCCFGSFVLVP